MISADLLSRITINPEQCGGRPCIRGQRIRVIDVLELLAAGESREQILEDYPYLQPDDIAASLLYAARRMDPQRRGLARDRLGGCATAALACAMADGQRGRRGGTAAG